MGMKLTDSSSNAEAQEVRNSVLAPSIRVALLYVSVIRVLLKKKGMAPATPADTTFIIKKKSFGSVETVCLQMIPPQKCFTYLS
jgi:hypothetical protein